MTDTVPRPAPDDADPPGPPATHDDRSAFSPVDWALFCAVGLIWGSSFLLIAVGLDALHPGTITWLRVGLGAAALALVPSARGRIERDDRARLVVVSFVWVAVPFTLFPLAEEHINSAVAGMLNGATPLFAGIVGALFFDRTPRGPQRWGIAVGFAGVVLVSLSTSAEGGTAFVGVAMVLVATLLYGVATNLAVPLSQRYGSVLLMSRMLALATVWTTPFGLWGLADSSFAWRPMAAVAVLGVVGTGLAFALMGTLVSRVGGPRSTFITYLIPVVALVLGAVFRDDRVQPFALAGIALVVGGAVLASRREQ